MSSKNQYSLKEAINSMLKAYKLDSKLSEVKLLNSWEKIMGKVIAKHTTNIYINKGKLYVTVDSAALREELHYGRDKMVKMLNEEAGVNVINEVILK